MFAKLSNLVSTTTLKYNFTVIEKIEDLQVKAESPHSSLLNLEQSSIDAGEEEEVVFILSVQAGSHLNYLIDFGDGNSDTKSSPQLLAKESVVIFAHQYDNWGVYNVTVKAENLIHSAERSYPYSVNVFEKVDNLIKTIKDVDYDEDLYEGSSIFDAESELFAILFGSAATKR